MLISLLTSRDVSWALVAGYLVASLIIIFLSLPVHECAHGFVAYKLGDPTAKYQGRLSLNPLKHIDYIGAAMILLVGFGWAKPVEVDMRRFKNPKTGMALTALAGPASNLLLALIALFIANLLNYVFPFYGNNTGTTILIWAITVLFLIAQINVSLAVFNLIPIPPLDGSRILNAFLPDRIYYRLMRYERYTFLAIFVLVYIFEDLLGGISEHIVSLLAWLTSLPFPA